MKLKKRRLRVLFGKYLKLIRFPGATATEFVLLIAIIAMMFFKFSKPSYLDPLRNSPKGDFGPYPHEKYLDSE